MVAMLSNALRYLMLHAVLWHRLRSFTLVYIIAMLSSADAYRKIVARARRPSCLLT
jgi:hypothetical protein